MININNFNKDGKIDFHTYHQAQIENGERCYECNNYLVYGPNNYRQLCHECKNMDSNEEVDHSKMVRCPYCKCKIDVHENELYNLYEEGEHEINCMRCNGTFEVSTSVSYSFKSPELNLNEDPPKI